MWELIPVGWWSPSGIYTETRGVIDPEVSVTSDH